MKKLERSEMKKLNGGVNEGSGNNYSCCIDYTNGSTETLTVCSDTVQHARAECLTTHSNACDATCSLAGS